MLYHTNKEWKIKCSKCDKCFWRRKWWSIMCCNMDRLRETFFDEKKFTIMFPTIQLKSERLNAVNVINVFWRRKWWWSIMCCNMDRMWETFFDEKKFIRHYVPYHELDVAWNVINVFLTRKVTKHQVLYHTAKEWKIKCSKCDKRFLTKNVMKHHVL